MSNFTSMPLLLLFLLFFFSFSFFSTPSLSDPRATKAALICTNRTAPSPSRQIFVSNFLSAMDALTPLVSRHGYALVNATATATAQSFPVYAFADCMRDLSPSDCNICVAQSKTQVLTCLPFQKGTRGGRLFFDGCYLRYDDYDFFAETLTDQDATVCGAAAGGSNSSVYEANALELVRNLSVSAPRNGGFSVGSVNRRNVSVYGLAQCWKTVNRSACSKCLEDAAARVGSCPPKEEGRALNTGCYLRYSNQKFYDNSTSAASASGNHGELHSFFFAIIRT